MNLSAEYRKEREGIETIEKEHGFVTYKLFSGECYVIDLYVRPDFRNTGLAAALGDEVMEIARKAECKIMTGSVDTRLESATTSAKVLFAYGMRILRCEGPVVYFVKGVQ